MPTLGYSAPGAELHRNKRSFAAVAAGWNAATASDLRPATIAQRKREIDKDLMLRFSDRHISSTSRLEMTRALKELKRAPRRLRATFATIFWASSSTPLTAV